MLFNLIYYFFIRKTKKFPRNFKMLVSNHHQKRHFSVHEGEFLQRFFECCIGLKEGYVFDVGGHIGIFSLTAALSGPGVRKVFVFEPTPWNFKTLQLNIKANRLIDKIFPFQIALGSVNSRRAISGLPESGWGGSSFLRKTHKGEKCIEVSIARGDDFIEAHSCNEPSVIKIDVEGFEYEVLKGFKETLRHSKPMLFIEFHPAYLELLNLNELDINEYLIGLGYQRIFRKKWINGDQYQTIYHHPGSKK